MTISKAGITLEQAAQYPKIGIQTKYSNIGCKLRTPKLKNNDFVERIKLYSRTRTCASK